MKLSKVAIQDCYYCHCNLLSRRAKEKRLKKDAGRTRWSQYFRSMKGTGAGGHSPRHDKLLDKDELKVDLDSTFGHHGECCTIIRDLKKKENSKWK